MIPSSSRAIKPPSAPATRDNEQRGIRLVDSANTPIPRIALLGDRVYSTMVSNSGSGYSRHGDMAINRWRNDGTRDNYGQWCYVRDLSSGLLWSAGHQPLCVAADSYRVTMSSERVVIEREDGPLSTRTDIVVVPGRAAESRRVTVSNSSNVEARVELTSYQEVVLATALSDRGHRAFSNLFVQTEWLAESASILAMRRPRSKEVKPSWGGHTIAVGSSAGKISCETDRARFVGRGKTSRNPVAMGKPGDLSGTVGAVLDPVFALRATLTIRAGGSGQVIFSTFAAEDRDEAVRLAKSFSNWETAVRSFDDVGDGVTDSDVSVTDEAIYQDLAGLLLYGARPAGSVIDQSADAVSTRADLLSIGITGEWPIVLARVNSRDSADKVVELLALHRYWRSKGIAADVVILCSTDGNDRRLLDDMMALVQVSSDSDVADQPAGVFIKDSSALRRQDIDLLDSIARIRMDCGSDSLGQIASG